MSASDKSEPATLAARVAAHGIESLRPRLLPAAPALSLVPTRDRDNADPDHWPSPADRLAPAAVLLPIIAAGSEPTVLFTRRTPHLARHAGQVSFPGGRAHAEDTDLVATALRETHEETGIAKDFVSVAGFLDVLETGTGFAIVPVVGLLREGFVLKPDPGEVAEIFEVPLAFLLDPVNRRRERTEWRGRTRSFWSYQYGEHYIWGATASILVNFTERLGAP